MPTGLIEVYARDIEVLGAAGDLPLPVFGDQPYPEDTRLKYRFLDLRREKLHQNIMLRGRIVDSLRARMKGQGFFEFQTPILTASSPEGRARLSGALAPASGQVLCAAAGPAAVQAAPDDGGLRPLFPDRALLPRRGPARRPAAGRILPARHRDELRRAGRRVRGDGAGRPRRVRGICRRQAGDALALAAHRLCRRHAQIRLRQARPAQPDRHAERLRASSAARASRCSRGCWRRRRTRSGRFPLPAAASAPSPTG